MDTDGYKGIQVGEELYDFVPDEHRLATEYVHKVWVSAGRPNRLEGEAAWKVMDGLFQIWGAMFPEELNEFKRDLQEDQAAERSVSEANRRDGGYVPISYPVRLMQFIKVYFPQEKLQDHDLILKFVHRYPLLKRTKHTI